MIRFDYPAATDDQMIMQGATAIANLTSLESMSDLGIHGINDAMLVRVSSLPVHCEAARPSSTVSKMASKWW